MVNIFLNLNDDLYEVFILLKMVIPQLVQIKINAFPNCNNHNNLTYITFCWLISNGENFHFNDVSYDIFVFH